MERLIAVGALCAATQASACDISLTDLTAEIAQALPEAQVVSSEGVSRFGNEPLFRYSLDFGAGEPVFVFEEFGCRTHNLRLVVLTPQTGLTPDDLGRISAVLQVAPLWQQQFADANLTGAFDALNMVADTAADWPVGVAVDDHIAASSMTSEAALNVANVGVPGGPFERLVVMTVAVGGV